jgi:pyrimidine operon attenuation protein/uracil phosphoribosyltransferase
LTADPGRGYEVVAMSKTTKRDRKEEGLVFRRELLDETGMARVLRRIATEILERNGGTRDLALVGIRTGGVFLAERLRRLVHEIEGHEVPMGIIDITLYRDDVFVGLPKPEVGMTELPFAVQGKVVVLVDDVLYTGRTVRAALDALMEFGRPRQVQLAVLCDRGLRELPIHADYVGITVQTTRRESVRVTLAETGETDRIILREKVEG